MNKGHVYQDSTGAFRWRIINVENGKIVANGGETFYNEYNAKRAGEAVVPDIEWITDPPQEVI